MTGKAVASILLLALVVTLVRAAEQHPSVAMYCIESAEQEQKLRGLMIDAMDQAFKEHMAHLFDIWVKDQAEEPARADAGAHIGISAYLRAQKSIVNWKPQRCQK